jgi:hypothetical protein
MLQYFHPDYDLLCSIAVLFYGRTQNFWGGAFATVVFLMVTSVLDVVSNIARQILLPSDNINLHHNA